MKGEFIMATARDLDNKQLTDLYNNLVNKQSINDRVEYVGPSRSSSELNASMNEDMKHSKYIFDSAKYLGEIERHMRQRGLLNG